ncbi:aromatic ring-hydroxylating dioxygenase subunit alpha [Pseudooceanicola sp. CBS1P-1]|uniref:Aromatic ring-hydroxylating dioxygenase subunit alpha n=1 Tax=Pseudooceanicola albus TaxID=2692189 RepID=A0A6L7GAR2_9RHOB|nr:MULTISPECIES: aromatic ring-hydroxylating dioxygenase subunit alpha [Pseudooceanicola]MBT9384481.1 aromatic ring-hydroxylating dioxygenase subunit alpha [Pseudooceanicola endophyticus]MXN20618.1 aromatic ring-hydroxylating dioxygenase subunit alpha [Pseudooceanicola albus]
MKDCWFPVGAADDIPSAPGRETLLMGEPIRLFRKAGQIQACDAEGRDLPVTVAYDHVWTSLGTPSQPIFAIPEAEEPGRRFVPCGHVRVACSPLRAVENFLDIAHFPFVHTDILGAEPHTEVYRYEVKIREEEDEVWATKVRFYQPQAAKAAEGGQEIEYMYRVPLPTASVLYKTCPSKPEAWDVIAIFVQPLTETTCVAWPWMALYDDTSSQADLVGFQQMIFLQDRAILENQVPALLPLDPGKEIPTRADMTSIAYRRWLKSHDYTYGAQLEAQ